MRVSKVLRAILGLGREVVIMSVEVETRVGTAASPGTFEGAQADILGTGDQRRTDASNGSRMERRSTTFHQRESRSADPGLTATYTRAQSDGFLTLLSDGDRLTGTYALGPEAGEWMQQATLAIRARVTLDVLRDTIRPFPIFSEVFVATLKALRGQALADRGVARCAGIYAAPTCGRPKSRLQSREPFRRTPRICGPARSVGSGPATLWPMVSCSSPPCGNPPRLTEEARACRRSR